MRQISAGSPTSAGFGCVDAKLYRAGILDPTTAPSRAARRDNARTSDLVVNGAVVMALGRSTRPAPRRHADRGSQSGFNWWSQHLDLEVSYGRAGGVGDRVDGVCADEVAGQAVVVARSGAGALARGRDGRDGRGGRACGRGFQAAGARWFREGGGMPTIGLAPRSGRYPCFVEREGIALLRAQGAGGREIARQLGRSPSTTSESCARDAATGCGKLDCRASVAQWKAELVARRPETAKLVTDERLRCCVEDRFWGRVHGADGPPAGSEGPDRRAATSLIEVTGAGCRDGAPNRSRNA